MLRHSIQTPIYWQFAEKENALKIELNTFKKKCAERKSELLETLTEHGILLEQIILKVCKVPIYEPVIYFGYQIIQISNINYSLKGALFNLGHPNEHPLGNLTPY